MPRVLTQQEITGLNAAWARMQKGTANEADRRNVEFARKQNLWFPSAGLQGTVSQQPSPTITTRQLPETPIQTGGRELPPEGGSLANLRFALAQVGNLARAQTRPTVGAELGQFSAAGVPLTTPSAIGQALEQGTLGRREVEKPIFERAFDAIQEQEKNKERMFSIFGAIIQKSPALLASLKPEDISQLQQGIFSTNFIQQIGQAAQTTELKPDVTSTPRVETAVLPVVAPDKGIIPITQPSEKVLSKLLTNYPSEFKAYIKSIAPTITFPLNAKTIGSQYQEWKVLKSKGVLPFGEIGKIPTEKSSEYGAAEQFLKDNPAASDDDLKYEIKKRTKLSTGEINILLKNRNIIAPPSEQKPWWKFW